MISIISAPASAPQLHVPPPRLPSAPKLDPIDLAIQQEIRSHGRYGCGIWSALNAISRAQGPGEREEQRRLRLRLWHRLKGLLHRGVLLRFGRKAVSSVKVPRERAVRRRRRLGAGSTFAQAIDFGGTKTSKHLSANSLSQVSPVPALMVHPVKTQTAVTPEDLSKAGRLLAQLPRRKKLRCGRIGAKPSYRGMPIWVNGRMGYVFGARAGKVIYTVEPGGPAGDPSSAGVLWGVASAKNVQAIKSPAAAVLGQGKRGITESPSARKQAAARVNGRCPARAGRKRGRRSRIRRPSETPALTGDAHSADASDAFFPLYCRCRDGLLGLGTANSACTGIQVRKIASEASVPSVKLCLHTVHTASSIPPWSLSMIPLHPRAHRSPSRRSWRCVMPYRVWTAALKPCSNFRSDSGGHSRVEQNRT